MLMLVLLAEPKSLPTWMFSTITVVGFILVGLLMSGRFS